MGAARPGRCRSAQAAQPDRCFSWAKTDSAALPKTIGNRKLEGRGSVLYNAAMNLEFMAEAARLALENVTSGMGGPFGAVIVKNGEIVARGRNCVTSSQDPTAHAEVSAIREAARVLNTFNLEGCEIYTSCEPCPMCLGAIYWARLEKVYYGCTQFDAAAIGFDDQFIYEEIAREKEERKLEFVALGREVSLEAFEAWKAAKGKVRY